MAALVGKRVSSAHSGANFGHQHAALSGELQDFAQRNFQVFLNVVAERFERRDVENFCTVQ